MGAFITCIPESNRYLKPLPTDQVLVKAHIQQRKRPIVSLLWCWVRALTVAYASMAEGKTVGRSCMVAYFQS